MKTDHHHCCHRRRLFCIGTRLHTTHGNAVGDPMSKWMDENGPDVEHQLMQFDGAHAVSLVNK